MSMKNFFLSLILVMSLMSCSNDDNSKIQSSEPMQFIKLDINYDENSTNSTFSENNYEIYEKETTVKNTETGEVFNVTFLIGLSDYDDRLYSLEVSDNFLEAGNITKEELQSEINNVVNGDPEEPKLSPHASCIQWCNQQYTDENGEKIKGRGGCKAGCWVDTAVRIIEALVPFA